MFSDKFLTANWENLAMFNYEVEPGILEKYLPPFTDIDYFEGKALVSIVGFMFKNTRVLGIKWPGHIHFEEVNLRFYVKYFDGSRWKRGVSFISEIVPKRMISFLANNRYNEHYRTAQMEHDISSNSEILEVSYKWKQKKGNWNSLVIKVQNNLQFIQTDSEEEFIFEHYFGYTRYNSNSMVEYPVLHPRWEVYPVIDYNLHCNIEELYGAEFVPYIQNKTPQSVFLAKGSGVSVGKPSLRTS